MKLTIKTKEGNYINCDTDGDPIYAVDRPLFIFMEKLFWDWLEDSNPANEYHAMYFDEEGSIYDKRSAIEAGITQLLEMSEEQNKCFWTEKEIVNADIECAFSG